MSVTVEKYNPAWPVQFQAIKSSLEKYLGSVPIVSIEHVGSTSVPGLAAKPIIDIDIIVMRENIDATNKALISNGKFAYLGELGIVDRHAFKDPNQDPRRNIYVCVDGAFQTRNHLAVRDTLRANPELRDEYGAVKLDLAARGTNIIDYIEAKGGVLQKILIASGVLTNEELQEIHQANLKGEKFGAIRTERLLLREFVMRDVDGFYELESQEEVVRYQTWPPRTRKQALEEVVKVLQGSANKPRNHIELAVEYEGRFIGRVGTNIKRLSDDGKALDIPHADLWFSFLPEYQGKGLATEAMEAFIPLLGKGLELEIECDPRNIGSSKMARRLGFEQFSLTEKAFECKGELVDSLVFRRLI
ncbi:acyl-CoA N-acyltransferase [Corynespora cassiicola Philippines]|uniref:Acyl-CoA N-acyltransferase n=1 Tax=Corynespora cassiicola Philippines TaxID=1448308 RepID=A0A2T2P2A3_CORCC|nr:acyl-CoA N-acyltransferase [Corynespora cassiicola Philippines]